MRSNLVWRFERMPIVLWRIVTGRHSIWSGEGARVHGGRWNPPGLAVIYAASSFAGALIEVLVHANRKSPPSGARFVRAEAPETISREYFDAPGHAGWDNTADVTIAQSFGRTWIEESRSALLFVPSVVTNGFDFNVVVNPNHPDTSQIKVGPEKPVTLDPRFFG